MLPGPGLASGAVFEKLVAWASRRSSADGATAVVAVDVRIRAVATIRRSGSHGTVGSELAAVRRCRLDTADRGRAADPRRSGLHPDAALRRSRRPRVPVGVAVEYRPVVVEAEVCRSSRRTCCSPSCSASVTIARRQSARRCPWSRCTSTPGTRWSLPERLGDRSIVALDRSRDARAARVRVRHRRRSP